MSGRETDRVPASFKVEFRKASSLLVCYSVNISRGGIFLATDADVPSGSTVTLDLEVPGSGHVTLKGQVTWQKLESDAQGPRGLGIHFKSLDHSLASFVDELVSNYLGIHFIVMSGDVSDAKNIERMLQSIVGTADITLTTESLMTEKLLSDAIDLVIIDIDEDENGAWSVIKRALSHESQIPVIALATEVELQERARVLGATESIGNPPGFDDMRIAVLRALGQPKVVQTHASS